MSTTVLLANYNTTDSSLQQVLQTARANYNTTHNTLHHHRQQITTLQTVLYNKYYKLLELIAAM